MNPYAIVFEARPVNSQKWEKFENYFEPVEARMRINSHTFLFAPVLYLRVKELADKLSIKDKIKTLGQIASYDGEPNNISYRDLENSKNKEKMD